MRKNMQVPISFKASKEGVIEGYGSVFGVEDSYSDVVRPGAFAESLKTDRMPAMLWQHDPSEPIGVWTEMREDATGLYVKGQLADTQRGREALSLMSLGAMSGLSIGYSTEAYSVDDKTGVRYLDAVKLWEVSPVTFPANDAARVTGVKNMTVRDFEQFLRDNGFSRKAAEAITASGFKAMQGEPAADLEEKQGEPADVQALKAVKAFPLFKL